MSSLDIRLRLTIRRHAVPDVRLVWPCAPTEDFTIAKLLVDVNEVIQLEGEEWGLEDYAVELADGLGGSFECLHFQKVAKVFKQDDQVLIRSLLTDDIRRRRLTGRHQISVDGRHLVDGIAFGRPWLRAPRDRPPMELPPRKRARFDNQDESMDELDEQAASGQLMLEGLTGTDHLDHSFKNSDDYLDEDDEDDDEDFRPDSESEPDLESHSERGSDLHYTVDGHGTVVPLDEEAKGDVSNSDEHEDIRVFPEENDNDPTESDTLQFMKSLDIPQLNVTLAALRTAFPLASLETILYEVVGKDQNIEEAYNALAASHTASLTFAEVLSGYLHERFNINESGEVINYDVPKLPLIEEVESTPLIQEIEMENDLNTADEHSFEETALDTADALISEVKLDSDDTSSSGTSESDDEMSTSGSEDEDDDSGVNLAGQSEDEELASAPDAEIRSSRSVPSGSVTTMQPMIEVVEETSTSKHPGISVVSDSSESESESLDDSSVDDSDVEDQGANKSSSVKPIGLSSKKKTDKTMESSSDSSSNSSSNSDSESSSSSDSDADSDSDSDSSSDSDSDSDAEESGPEETTSKQSSKSISAPQPSQTATGATNLVQKAQQNQVPPGQGFSRTKSRNTRRKIYLRYQLQAAKDSAEALNQELLKRKQALLDCVNDSSPAPPPQSTPVVVENKSAVEKRVEETQEQKASDDIANAASGNSTDKQSGLLSADDTKDGSNEDSTQRRMRMDKGASRRLVFGALGLKNPKTKEDEEKIKTDLMKNVVPLKNHQKSGETDDAKMSETAIEEDSENWRDKVTVRAVECCHENVVLSEPPFPFVQRWDPQQQYQNKRKRKRGSKQAHQYDYDYYDESQAYDDWDESQVVEEMENDNDNLGSEQKREKSKTKKGHEKKKPERNGDDIELEYDDPPITTPVLPSPKGGEDSQFTDADDLPSLPNDVSSLALLRLDTVKTGMVITWKYLLMSKATNWTPQLLSVTGIVLSISEDHVLDLLLAKRDREEDDREYDEVTGERIYDKFEAPYASDDEEIVVDDGRRELCWGDLIEPRVVQAEPCASIQVSSISESRITPVEGNGNETEVEDVNMKDRHGSSLFNRVNSMQMRASIEKELQNLRDIQDTQDKQVIKATQQSTSIPSCQISQHSDWPSTSQDDVPISNEENQAQSSQNEQQIIPSSQPELSSQIDIFPPQSPGDSHVSSARPEPEVDGNTFLGFDGSYDDPLSNNSAEYELPSLNPDRQSSVDTDKTSQGPSESEQKIQKPQETKSIVPSSNSSPSSPRSGRQPRSSLVPIADTGADEESSTNDVIPETCLLSCKDEPLPKANDAASNASSDTDVLFPSIEEIWHTAPSSRKTHSPLKSSQISRLGKIIGEKIEKEDNGYEKAMKKLDDDQGSESPVDGNKSIRSLFPNATQPSALPDSSAPKMPSSSQSITSNNQPRSKRRRSSPFRIPEGSQVTSLSSSPISDTFARGSSADDVEDETYQDNASSRSSSLPKGEGWVQKIKRPSKRKAKNSSKTSATSTYGKKRNGRKF